MISESIAAIQARIIAFLQADTNLYDPGNPDPTKRGLTSTSQTSRWRSFLNVISTEMQTMQQLMQTFEAEVEARILVSIAATARWIQDKVFQFQYSATTPQVVEINHSDFTVAYPVIDETLRIISRCSVKTDTNKTVKIKVATSEPPTALSAPQLVALGSYLDAMLPAGIGKNIISLASDKISVTAEVFYNGQYAPTIQADVIAALDAFLANIPFDGVVEISEIEDAIQAVAGVEDIVISEVKARDDATPYSGATVVVKDWETYAGYIVQETTGGATFADTLTFTVQS